MDIATIIVPGLPDSTEKIQALSHPFKIHFLILRRPMDIANGNLPDFTDTVHASLHPFKNRFSVLRRRMEIAMTIYTSLPDCTYKYSIFLTAVEELVHLPMGNIIYL